MQVSERCLTAFRVLGEVDAVRLVFDVLVAAEEDSVEERRAELAHAATHVHRAIAAVDLAVDDGCVAHIALGFRTLADFVID